MTSQAEREAWIVAEREKILEIFARKECERVAKEEVRAWVESKREVFRDAIRKSLDDLPNRMMAKLTDDAVDAMLDRLSMKIKIDASPLNGDW